MQSDAFATFCFSFELIKPKSHYYHGALFCMRIHLLWPDGAEKKVTLDQFHALFGADWDGSINGWINYIACSKGLKWYARRAPLPPPQHHCQRQSEKAGGGSGEVGTVPKIQGIMERWEPRWLNAVRQARHTQPRSLSWFEWSRQAPLFITHDPRSPTVAFYIVAMAR